MIISLARRTNRVSGTPTASRRSAAPIFRMGVLAVALVFTTLIGTSALAAPAAPTPSLSGKPITGHIIRPNTVMTDWSACIYDPISTDTYHASLVYNGYGVYCGKKDILGSGGFGVRHINEAHTFRSNTDACIQKVLAYGSNMPASQLKAGNYGKVLPGNGVKAYVIYTAEPSLAPVSERYSVITAYTNGTGGASADWTGCMAI